MVWSTAHTGKIALLVIGCISREWNRERRRAATVGTVRTAAF